MWAWMALGRCRRGHGSSGLPIWQEGQGGRCLEGPEEVRASDPPQGCCRGNTHGRIGRLSNAGKMATNIKVPTGL